ncbi:hypothetical protein CSKR_112045 [Clonorchis sinensis]|uniref:Uncharacterized protein n=1 Tax=Clonorchis sinensis TaxID=79923 RepID=A0A3R7C8R9_CLOSI|nr:hypothetical protein CSKR_112045 [Clonorchis sinensis]
MFAHCHERGTANAMVTLSQLRALNQRTKYPDHFEGKKNKDWGGGPDRSSRKASGKPTSQKTGQPTGKYKCSSERSSYNDFLDSFTRKLLGSFYTTANQI